MIFSDTYISETEAESRLSYASSGSSARAKATSSLSSNHPVETTAELSTRSYVDTSSTNNEFNSKFTEIPESYEYMLLDSSPYLCSVPQVTVTKQNKTAAADSKAEEEKELARAANRGWELLKDMEGQCMYFISGWWSYSFCYNTAVKQFHQLPPGRGGTPVYPPIEDSGTPSYVLGTFQEINRIEHQRIDDANIVERRLREDANKAQQEPPHVMNQDMNAVERQRTGGMVEETKRTADVARLQTKGDVRYLVQKLSGGTTCDLTGKERKIEVQFHCHPQSTDRIGWIKEVSTCSYLMVVYTPRLCHDVAFLPPREAKAHQIVCHEIIREDDADEWRARKAAEADRKLVAASENEGQSRPVVGGIEVGGMKIVGKDGNRIEPPKAVDVGHGKADVIAKSDPDKKGIIQRLSNEDLEKLDLDPETVEQLREKLQELAGDKGWTLEVVDGPGGLRELRGIVEGDEEGRVETAGDSDDADEVGEEGEQDNEKLYKDEL